MSNISNTDRNPWHTGKPDKGFKTGIILGKVNCPAQEDMLCECFFDENLVLQDLSTGCEAVGDDLNGNAAVKWLNLTKEVDKAVSTLQKAKKVLKCSSNLIDEPNSRDILRDLNAEILRLKSIVR